ncbi:Putative rhomboid protease [Sporothrix eucalyptigena]|uniref:rhomboid protease n=1 Tax=Sporothrix eucalyptigena TaxID=1812306 RepID=A0ABP0BPK7_9PEZI
MPAASTQPRRSGIADLWTPRGGSSSGSPAAAAFNPTRSMRSYLARLPLFTRVVAAIIVALYILDWLPFWDLRAWGSLVPSKLSFATLYRTNTFPLIHISLFHMLANVAALIPLMDRFECEHGTITTLALFFGPFSTLPALLYVAFERICRLDTIVMGASIWVFLLLGVEAIRTYRTNPSLVIATVPVPTWSTPLFLVFVIAVFVPGTSMSGHLAGLAVGYLCGFGYLKFLSPPESALRWIEARLNLLARVPHYVSVDQKTYGRFGVLPTVSGSASGATPAIGLVGSTQRLGP